MFVILCNSFDDARDGFARFMDFLETYEPSEISKVFEFSYCVETSDDTLRYIFVDRRMIQLTNVFDEWDKIELDEFFEGLDDYYYENGGKYYDALYPLWK